MISSRTTFIILAILISSFLAYIYHAIHTESELENAVYEWTEGKVYCGVCKRFEEIEYVRVGKRFDGSNRFVSIATKNHYNEKTKEYAPFNALALVDGCHIRKMKIGIHPGCLYDCRGCDKYGWE